jgi:amino acid permease
MSETLDTNGGAPQGKGLAIGGFVLSLVTLVLSSWIAAIALASLLLGGSAWLMYLWLVLSIMSVVFSVMGMSKLKKTGGKRGIGIAGMVIGIVAVVYCTILTLGLGAAEAGAGAASDELRNQIEQQMNQ